MLTTTLVPVTLTDFGDGVNFPLALTPEPAMVIAVEESDDAVRTYSLALIADAGRVIVAAIDEVLLLFTTTLLPMPHAVMLDPPETDAACNDPVPASSQSNSP